MGSCCTQPPSVARCRSNVLEANFGHRVQDSQGHGQVAVVPEQTSCSMDVASGALTAPIAKLVKGLGRGQQGSWQGQLPVSCMQGWPDDWAPDCSVQVGFYLLRLSGKGLRTLLSL